MLGLTYIFILRIARRDVTDGHFVLAFFEMVLTTITICTWLAAP